MAVQCYLVNDDNNKTLRFNFNWDANRDPNQKLLITANYRKNGDFKYVSDVIMSYPGRTIKADYTFSLESKYLEGNFISFIINHCIYNFSYCLIVP